MGRCGCNTASHSQGLNTLRANAFLQVHVFDVCFLAQPSPHSMLPTIREKLHGSNKEEEHRENSENENGTEKSLH